MNYAKDDIMVRAICGTLTERERSAIKYRKVKDILMGEQTLLESGIQGAPKLAKTLLGANPVLGMLELQRSATQTQIRSENPFDRTRLAYANQYAFTPEVPINTFMDIFNHHLLTSPSGIPDGVIVDNMLEDMVLALGEDQIAEAMEKKDETGSFGTGDPLSDGLMEMMEQVRRGERPDESKIKNLLDRAKDLRERSDIGMKTMIEREEMALDEALGAQDLADLQGFRSAYKEKPLLQLDRAYGEKLTKKFGIYDTPERRRALRAQGLQAPTRFKTLTREERYRIFENLWGGDYQGALDALDKIALGERGPVAGEPKALTQLMEEVAEQKPLDEGESTRNIQTE